MARFEGWMWEHVPLLVAANLALTVLLIIAFAVWVSMEGERARLYLWGMSAIGYCLFALLVCVGIGVVIFNYLWG